MLILLGVQPSEIAMMSIQTRNDVLAMHETQEALARGKMPGQK